MSNSNPKRNLIFEGGLLQIVAPPSLLHTLRSQEQSFDRRGVADEALFAFLSKRRSELDGAVLVQVMVCSW